MKQIYLLTGENAFQLREEKRRWIEQFCVKFGEENCARIHGSESTIRSLLDEIAVMPFAAEKRLVVCDGIIRAEKEEIQSLESHIHPQVLLLFVDAKPDKRTAGVKALLDVADVKEFSALKRAQLRQWMQVYAQSHGMTFSVGAAEQLVEYVGEDQDTLSQEILKLSAAVGATPVTKSDIELHVIPTDEGVIWKISDLLSSGDRSGALKFARRLLDRGGDAYGLWAILLNMLKNLVAVSAAANAGHQSPKDIADATGVHIFAVRSLQMHARRAKASALKSFLMWSADADRDVKTGAYRSTDEAPQELLALIDRFILTCP